MASDAKHQAGNPLQLVLHQFSLGNKANIRQWGQSDPIDAERGEEGKERRLCNPDNSLRWNRGSMAKSSVQV